LMKRKDYLSREDRTRALTNIGLVKRKLMKWIQSPNWQFWREEQGQRSTKGNRRTAIVTCEQTVSQDAWKETLKNVVMVARTMTGRDNILSIVRKSLNMPEVEGRY
jgi:hypothetical protein